MDTVVSRGLPKSPNSFRESKLFGPRLPGKARRARRGIVFLAELKITAIYQETVVCPLLSYRLRPVRAVGLQ